RSARYAPPEPSSSSTAAAAASCGTVNVTRRVRRSARLTTWCAPDDTPICSAMAGHRSAAGGRSSSARARATTRRSSSSVVRHDHPARAVGKPPDRLLEIERQLVYHGATRHRVEHILGIVIASPFGAERRAACQDHVDRQAVQPGPERRLAAERAELAPGADE